MISKEVIPAQYLKIGLLGILVLTCLFSLNQIKVANYFPIKIVRVYGVNHIDQHEVQQLVLPLVDRGFFNINVERIRERLMRLPWVSDIFVHRSWPDKIEITVVEKNAVARWNDQTLLSKTGELFAPKQETYPIDLPEFVGPNGQQIFMLEYFDKINRLLSPLHAKISYLELTPFLTWKLKLNNGITLQIGHKDILTRLDHFVKVYPKIVGENAKAVDYVDLRYPNGMAVRWKTAIKV